MGVHDEHWCSRCHKELDKKEDTYFNINIVAGNDGAAASPGKARGSGAHRRF